MEEQVLGLLVGCRTPYMAGTQALGLASAPSQAFRYRGRGPKEQLNLQYHNPGSSWAFIIYLFSYLVSYLTIFT